jgi:molecular chaperone IbpA
LIKSDENHYIVELAVAGFTQDMIDIQVEDGVLTIEGKVEGTEVEREFIHKGIGARAFKRSFTLADTVEVRGADLVNGILTVELENVIPEEKKPRKIEIGTSGKTLLTEDA